VSDKEEMGSCFKECEQVNGYKPWIQKMQSTQSNTEKPRTRFVVVKSEHMIDQI